MAVIALLWQMAVIGLHAVCVDAAVELLDAVVELLDAVVELFDGVVELLTWCAERQ